MTNRISRPLVPTGIQTSVSTNETTGALNAAVVSQRNMSAADICILKWIISRTVMMNTQQYITHDVVRAVSWM